MSREDGIPIGNKNVCKFFLENLSKGAEYFGSWDWGQDRQQKCVQNCLCGATPQHFIVRETLKKILLHVQTQNYGQHSLYTSGPCVLGDVVTIRSMPGMRKEKNAVVKQSIIVTVPFSDNTSN